MLLVLLFILFVIMLFLAYFLFKKDIIEPTIIFLASYVLSIFCTIINIKKWGIEFSVKTFLILFIGSVEFLLVSYVIINKFKNKEIVKNENEYRISKFVTIAIICYDVIALIVLIKNVINISAMYEPYTNFSRTLQIYKQHTSYSKDVQLPGYVTIMIKPIIASAYIYIFLFIKRIVTSKQKIFNSVLKNAYFLIPAVIYIIQRFAESNRGSIINFVVSSFVMYFIVFNIKNNWNEKVKISTILKLTVLGIFSLVVFYFSAQLVGRVNSKGIIDYITCYCGGSIECFDLYIKEDYIAPDFSGQQTFGRTIRDLNKLKLINTKVIDTDTQEFKYYKDNMIGNVYTAYYRWMSDFGVIGIILLQLIFAFTFNMFYNFIKYYKYNERSRDFFIIIYSYLTYTIFMHPIESLFYLETFTISTVGVFLTITVLYFLITSTVMNVIFSKQEYKKSEKKNNLNKIKVLYITPALNVCGGIESYCMAYYRHMSEKVKIDFATHEILDNTYKNEIENKGGKVYLFEPLNLKKLIKSVKQIKHFFEQNSDYDIIHCNMVNAAIFYFYYAKKNGIRVRIIHSHQNNYADKLLHAIRNIPLIKMGNLLATDRFACSKVAGDFLFKNKPYYIVKNAIELEKYRYNDDIRKKIRIINSLNDNTFVIGNVGRLTEQKNQIKLIDIMKELVFNLNKDVKLLIIGNGHLKEKLISKTKEYCLQDNVIFVGSVNNVQDYLQAMDCFVLPSLYEGVGIVNIEAQAAGLPTIVSDKVPIEAKVTNLLKYVKLKESSRMWASTILRIGKNKHRKNNDYINEISNNGYDIKKEGIKLEKKYFDLINKDIEE